MVGGRCGRAPAVAGPVHAAVEEVVTVTEPEPRTIRHADGSFSALPEPVPLELTVVEQPASCDPPSGGWDGADGDD
jgi:hypothetical protein